LSSVASSSAHTDVLRPKLHTPAPCSVDRYLTLTLRLHLGSLFSIRQGADFTVFRLTIELEMLSFTSLIYGLVMAIGLYTTACAAGLQSISDWGPNPSKIAQLQVYIPAQLASKPAVLLGVSAPGIQYLQPQAVLLSTIAP